MSKATKFKYVAKEILEDFPEPDDEHPIMRVLSTLGNNLHEVESPTGEKILVNMPMKFRRNVWIKKGDFVMIEFIDEVTKVKGDITHILYAEQIKHIKSTGKWPAEFEDSDRKTAPEQAMPSDADEHRGEGESDSSSDEMEEVFVNRNRQHRYMETDSEDSGSESDDEASASANDESSAVSS